MCNNCEYSSFLPKDYYLMEKYEILLYLWACSGYDIDNKSYRSFSKESYATENISHS